MSVNASLPFAKPTLSIPRVLRDMGNQIMKLEISEERLVRLVARQLGNLFEFDPERELQTLSAGVERAVARCEVCFAKTANKYYRRGGEVFFSPWHSGQYSIFLYFLANSLAKYPSAGSLPDRVYYLNKALNGLDLFYEVEMPTCFFLDHPIGSVLGRAVYGEFFSFSQHCTVGNNRGLYPVLGQNVKMMSGSKILGNCRVGDHVVFAANTYVKDVEIPSCSLVFGSGRDLIIKSREIDYFTSGLRL